MAKPSSATQILGPEACHAALADHMRDVIHSSGVTFGAIALGKSAGGAAVAGRGVSAEGPLAGVN